VPIATRAAIASNWELSSSPRCIRGTCIRRLPVSDPDRLCGRWPMANNPVPPSADAEGAVRPHRPLPPSSSRAMLGSAAWPHHQSAPTPVSHSKSNWRDEKTARRPNPTRSKRASGRRLASPFTNERQVMPSARSSGRRPLTTTFIGLNVNWRILPDLNYGSVVETHRTRPWPSERIFYSAR